MHTANKAVRVERYLKYLDKEMTIMGILSGFCVTALGDSVTRYLFTVESGICCDTYAVTVFTLHRIHQRQAVMRRQPVMRRHDTSVSEIEFRTPYVVAERWIVARMLRFMHAKNVHSDTLVPIPLNSGSNSLSVVRRMVVTFVPSTPELRSTKAPSIARCRGD
jgi:hypothetical protein